MNFKSTLDAFALINHKESMELLFIVLVTLSATLLAISLRFYSLVWTLKTRKNSPPQAAGAWPLLGHFSVFSGPELPHITLSNMADKYGPIFGIRVGVHLAVIISSHEIAKESYNSYNDSVFSDRAKTAAIQYMAYNFAMFAFSPYGPHWREARKISMMLLLSSKKVALYGDLIENKVRATMTSLYKSCVNGDGYKHVFLDMKEWLGDLTMNLMVRIVAGEVLKQEMDMQGSSRKWKKALQQFFKMMGDVTISDVIPILKWTEYFRGGKVREFKKTGKDMDSMLQTWLDFHKMQKSDCKFTKEKEESFMSQLLDATEDVEFSSYDADTVKKATSQAMMLGGTDTMTGTLTWALSLLLNNPENLKRVQDELDINIGRERQIARGDVKNLAYLKAVIKETLRLYPVAPLAPTRVAREDCKLAGYHVQAGTWLILNTWKLHRDPRVWNNALEFVPERFLTDHKEVDVRGQHFELLPFGSGRRICPGVSLSLQIMELVLASLLHGFDIETRADGPVEMSSRPGFTNMKANPLHVFLKPRLSSNLYL